MAEDIKKGIVVEYDFTVVPGAQILYKATEELLKEYDIPFSPRIEAQYLIGASYLAGLSDYFAFVKTKRTAAKAAKDLATAFSAELSKCIPQYVTEDFKAFVNYFIERKTKVIVATRANFGSIADAFAELTPNPDFTLFQETSSTYGTVQWDDWRRASAANRIRSIRTLAVAGSGLGVKSALQAGMGAVAVANDHVAYQDYSGADEIFEKLDLESAKRISRILRV